MAQFNSAERIDRTDEYNGQTEHIQVNDLMIEPTDVMTGGRNRSRFLYYQLKMSMMKAEQIDIIVSFLMESGVRMILNDIRAALERGGKGEDTDRELSGNHTALGAISDQKGIGRSGGSAVLS